MEASGRFEQQQHYQHHHHHHRRSGWDNSSAHDQGYDEANDPEPPGGSEGESRHRRHSRRHHLDDSRGDYSSYRRQDSCWEHDKFDDSDYRHRSSRDFGDERRRSHDYDDLDRERGRRKDKDRGGGGGGGRHGGRDRTTDVYTPDGSRSPYTSWQEESRPVQEEQQPSVQVPTGTIVVKGLSQKTVEDDLYRALERWGPLRHVRVIKEKVSGVSRGFAFVDLPSVDAAEKLMASIGTDGITVNGRRLFLEYSSRPSGGAFPDYRFSGQASKPLVAVPSDWICALCGYLNFARRVVCLQCNEARGEEATDLSTSGYRGPEPAPSHVLAVRGLDDNVDEEILHYEFSKHAPIKDLRLIRDKFTHVSRGYAFIHFHSVEDAVKALEASNGTAIDKNGQILRVAFAKSPYGLHGGPLLTAAASCAQQYDASGWEPKEYDARSELEEGDKSSGFVWDEASGYYYDAATKFYYDANRNLYYDGTHGVWYTFNQELQQYQAYTAASAEEAEPPKPVEDVSASETKDRASSRKQYAASAVISAPAVVRSDAAADKVAMSDAAASSAAKDKLKEVRLTSKNSGKKKLNSTFNLWKQRMNEAATEGEEAVRREQTSGADESEAVLRAEATSGPRVGSKRRFTETTPQYRDRAAERRSLYGLSVPGDPLEEMASAGGAPVQSSGGSAESYEAVTVDKALDESNVGNRMLRSMGWQEGSGLGKEGTGIVEPVQAHVGTERAGLGSQRSRFEVQPGDSYRAIIQKKSFARFHDML
ncbi:SUPPRESSOR OF ABI3-5 isoform X1 [Selaginella moellendorffii]|uniref:SUPPRESSOR OF ABI3-5 isoform X1 n=1 Tax=Selaginella moellendorffii TaxID=88036 RepID=UPI000D1D0D7E|nr:SUPPRESSOR OF ABI3-5 isoform X1 [Selaginella moellendorffii]XP_024523729.1 SUPPRESSOR OF ABI3-5 isoform X1 [Selaginella moellendorffii]|eukprot:XP_024523682.1 SUPPRESSOR OF ABI3-5 isoform X1 [Selaginella moellendorffii]